MPSWTICFTESHWEFCSVAILHLSLWTMSVIHSQPKNGCYHKQKHYASWILKNNFWILQPRPYFPIFLCLFLFTRQSFWLWLWQIFPVSLIMLRNEPCLHIKLSHELCSIILITSDLKPLSRISWRSAPLVCWKLETKSPPLWSDTPRG